jgi:S23 ribosomal protein.
MREQTNDNSKEQSSKREAARRGRRRPHWRFEDLDIWNKAVDLAVKFHRIADRLDKRRLYRYAEQLRAAGLSISNNIAEGSGSIHNQEFIQFLNITRRSLFEDAVYASIIRKGRLARNSRSGRTAVGLRRRESKDHEFFTRALTPYPVSPLLFALASHRLTISIAQSG